MASQTFKVATGYLRDAWRSFVNRILAEFALRWANSIGVKKLDELLTLMYEEKAFAEIITKDLGRVELINEYILRLESVRDNL